jgi:hypothetical protein
MIPKRRIDEVYRELRPTYGGDRSDYFGLLYLEKEFGVPREQAVRQIAFGGGDHGLSGFHFDRDRRNLYLFQFNESSSHASFKQPMQRLVEAGMERVFLSPKEGESQDQWLLQLRSCMIENRALIDQVCIRCVFTGDPAEAERSQVLDKLREDLENKKHLVDQFFSGKQTTLVVEYRSVDGRVGPVVDARRTHVYDLPLAELIAHSGPAGQVMHIGFIKLVDLHKIHQEMGNRFFERNIRYGLGDSKAVNRALTRAFRQMVLEGRESPAAFAFHHNGVTMFAELLERVDGLYRVTAPRLLNGAQTVTTFGEFLEANRENPQFAEHSDRLEELRVMCRVLTNASQEFVTSVTINNNRQNPVEPWNLHANDLIQLELQDKFRTDLGVYYERQEEAFENLSQEEMEEQGITEVKAVKLVPLTRTFLVAEGDIDKLSRLREVFEEDALYEKVFNPSRLHADLRRVLLCYKMQFRIRKFVREIMERGRNKYEFVGRAKNLVWALLCQGLLNHPDLDQIAEAYGRSMSIPADYTALLADLATSRVRLLLSELIADPAYAGKAAEGAFEFLKSNRAYNRCMDAAEKRWDWSRKKLK